MEYWQKLYVANLETVLKEVRELRESMVSKSRSSVSFEDPDAPPRRPKPAGPGALQRLRSGMHPWGNIIVPFVIVSHGIDQERINTTLTFWILNLSTIVLAKVIRCAGGKCFRVIMLTFTHMSLYVYIWCIATKAINLARRGSQDSEKAPIEDIQQEETLPPQGQFIINMWFIGHFSVTRPAVFRCV